MPEFNESHSAVNHDIYHFCNRTIKLSYSGDYVLFSMFSGIESLAEFDHNVLQWN